MSDRSREQVGKSVHKCVQKWRRAPLCFSKDAVAIAGIFRTLR